jgi:hypothetical protein
VGAVELEEALKYDNNQGIVYSSPDGCSLLDTNLYPVAYDITYVGAVILSTSSYLA